MTINKGYARILGALLLTSSLCASGMNMFSDALSSDFGDMLQSHDAPELQGGSFLSDSYQLLGVSEFQSDIFSAQGSMPGFIPAQQPPVVPFVSVSSHEAGEIAQSDQSREDEQLESADRSEEAEVILQLSGRGVKRKAPEETFTVSVGKIKKIACSYPDCGVRCNSPKALEEHFRVHTQEKPFKCEQCGRSFRLKGNLRIHLATHNTERPFVCQHCDKGFKRASNLNQHIRTHDLEKKWKCDICSKFFGQKNYLKKHMKKMHLAQTKPQIIIPEKEKPNLPKKQQEFTCEICRISYKEEKWYVRHIDEHLRIARRDGII